MCIRNALQRSIHNHTGGGEEIAQFLAETMRGETPAVKINHRLDAAKQLIKFGFDDTDADRVSIMLPTPEEISTDNPAHNKPAEPPASAPATRLDIINYEMARQIRSETADGHTIAEFLVKVMNDRQLPTPFTPKSRRITPYNRMAAAKELLKRGFGALGSPSRATEERDETNDSDLLHTDLAKRMRRYSENGAQIVRFLIDVMNEQDPEDGFSSHHRVSAAQELLRRGWDINYDAVTPEDLRSYWNEYTAPRLSIGQKKTIAGESTYADEYDIYNDDEEQANRVAIVAQYRKAIASGGDEAAQALENKFYNRDKDIEFEDRSPSAPTSTVEYAEETAEAADPETPRSDENWRAELDAIIKKAARPAAIPTPTMQYAEETAEAADPETPHSDENWRAELDAIIKKTARPAAIPTPTMQYAEETAEAADPETPHSDENWRAELEAIIKKTARPAAIPTPEHARIRSP